MAAKGMSMTLTIIVAAVVILVTALILLAILGGSLEPIVSVSQARAQCSALGGSSCDLTGQLPPTWYSDIYKTSTDGIYQSCYDFTGVEDCSDLEMYDTS